MCMCIVSYLSLYTHTIDFFLIMQAHKVPVHARVTPKAVSFNVIFITLLLSLT